MVTGARTPLTVDLSGQRVAITAGANGIGKVMADSFAACGASVFISDIDGAAVAACGHPGMRADAGVAADNQGFVDAAVRHLGGLDVMVNNAGVAGPTGLVENVAAEELDATLPGGSAFRCARLIRRRSGASSASPNRCRSNSGPTASASTPSCQVRWTARASGR
jgi:NAD(P)-dependent dehydrogenase (short-subunit alcohol dehydrogenase family)